MESHKLAVKFFVQNPSGLQTEEFVPVFHRWIQGQVAQDHLLIDVADYGHVHEGPGAVLVSHEANFHMDLGDGRLGLMYVRKQPIPSPVGTPASLRQRLRAVFKYALQACAALEDEPTLGGRVRFRTDEAIFRVHDRLLAPNTPETFDSVKRDLGAFLQGLYGAPVELEHRSRPETLFEVAIRAPQSPPVATMLERASTA